MRKLILLLLFVPLVSFGQTAKEYFINAYEKSKNEDPYGAISDYTKAINLNPEDFQLVMCYVNRASQKKQIGDLQGAIADYTKAINIKIDETQLPPEYNNFNASAYYGRANAKSDLEDP